MHTRIAIALLALAAGSLSPAFGQPFSIYLARPLVTSTNTEVWDAPFYWIANGGTAFALSGGASTAMGIPSHPGSYYHLVNTMTVGEGFGIVHTLGTEPGYGCLRYQVQVTVPAANASSDVIMSVSSTNCDIGSPGNPNTPLTETDAFRGANSGDRWWTVCYLTCRVGVTQPHIEFKYLSGTAGRLYADGVKFVPPCCSCCVTSLSLAIQPPICTNVPYVTVTGVTNADDYALCIYQRVGATETCIGQLTNGIVLGANVVPVTWRADSVGAQIIVSRVSALRVESCHSYQGCTVGSGELRIGSLADGVLHYSGGSGYRIVLLKSADPGLALSDWQRAGTNAPTAEAFSIPAGAESAMFYCLKSE